MNKDKENLIPFQSKKDKAIKKFNDSRTEFYQGTENDVPHTYLLVRIEKDSSVSCWFDGTPVELLGTMEIVKDFIKSQAAAYSYDQSGQK